MGRIMTKIYEFISNEHGATAIEYAIIASLISIFIMLAVTSVGTTMNDLYYQKVTDGLNR